MRRLLVLRLCRSLAVSFAASAQAAPAPAPAAAQAGDLFTVTDIRVDATAESAQTARDAAMAQGRPQAWTRIYRRLDAARRSGPASRASPTHNCSA